MHLITRVYSILTKVISSISSGSTPDHNINRDNSICSTIFLCRCIFHFHWTPNGPHLFNALVSSFVVICCITMTGGANTCCYRVLLYGYQCILPIMVSLATILVCINLLTRSINPYIIKLI